MCRLASHILNDQMGFESLYHKRSIHEMRTKVAILEPYVLNSILPAMGKQEKHHAVLDKCCFHRLLFDLFFILFWQVLHLAAESDSFRKEVFSTAAATLCKTISPVVMENGRFQPLKVEELPPQLGLNREYLNAVALKMFDTFFFILLSDKYHTY